MESRLLRSPVLIGSVFVLLAAVLLLNARLLPFVDLPNHLAEAVIFRKLLLNDPQFETYYRMVPWFYPNTLHAYFTSLFGNAEVGDRLYFLVYLLLLPSSVFLVIRKTGGNQWVGLLSLLLIFNYNATFGFVGFYMAIPVTVFFFYSLLDERKSVPYLLVPCCLLVLIYFLHAQAALFAMMLLGLIHLVRFRYEAIQLWRTVIILLPVLILIIVWWNHRGSGEQSTFDYLVDYYTGTYFAEFGRRSAWAVLDFYHLFDKPWGFLIGILFTAVIVVPALFFVKYDKQYFRKLFSGNRMYLIVFVAASFLCFFFLPSKLPGQTPLYERFSTYLILSLVLVIATVVPDRGRYRLFVTISLGTYLLLWGHYFYRFNEVNREFNRDFLNVPGKKSMLYGLIYDYQFRGRPVYIHFPNYHTIWNEGPASSKIIDYRFGIVRRMNDNKIPFYNEWIGRTYELVKTYPAEYILTHGSAKVTRDSNLVGFDSVRSTGKWSIYMRSD